MSRATDGPIAATFRAVQRLTRSGRPVPTADIARALRRSSASMNAALTHLERTGWIERREYPTGRGGSVRLKWTLTAKARREPYAPGLPYTDTPERILELVTGDSAWTIRHLCETMQRPYETVRRAADRLTREGKLEKVVESHVSYYSRPLLDEDDGWQPPAQYVSALRAQILGLRKRAA